MRMVVKWSDDPLDIDLTYDEFVPAIKYNCIRVDLNMLCTVIGSYESDKCKRL